MKKVFAFIIIIACLVIAFFQIPSQKVNLRLLITDIQLSRGVVNEANRGFDEVLKIDESIKVRTKIGEIYYKHTLYEDGIKFMEKKVPGLVSDSNYWRTYIRLQKSYNTDLKFIGELYVRAVKATKDIEFENFVEENTPPTPILSAESGYYLNPMVLYIVNYDDTASYKVTVNNKKM